MTKTNGSDGVSSEGKDLPTIEELLSSSNFEKKLAAAREKRERLSLAQRAEKRHVEKNQSRVLALSSVILSKSTPGHETQARAEASFPNPPTTWVSKDTPPNEQSNKRAAVALLASLAFALTLGVGIGIGQIMAERAADRTSASDVDVARAAPTPDLAIASDADLTAADNWAPVIFEPPNSVALFVAPPEELLGAVPQPLINNHSSTKSLFAMGDIGLVPSGVDLRNAQPHQIEVGFVTAQLQIPASNTQSWPDILGERSPHPNRVVFEAATPIRLPSAPPVARSVTERVKAVTFVPALSPNGTLEGIAHNLRVPAATTSAAIAVLSSLGRPTAKAGKPQISVILPAPDLVTESRAIDQPLRTSFGPALPSSLTPVLFGLQSLPPHYQEPDTPPFVDRQPSEPVLQSARLGFHKSTLDQINLRLLAPAALDETSVFAFREALNETGFEVAGVARPPVTVSKSHLRYYNDADLAVAQAISEVMGFELRDFTSTSAPTGLIEVWIEGRSGATARVRSTAPSRTTRQPRRVDPVAALRNRLANQLRNGEHIDD